MPPKRDYTQGPPPTHDRPFPNREGEPQPPQPRKEPHASETRAATKAQPQVPRQQTSAVKGVERPPFKGHLFASVHHTGSASTAAEVGQDDGFTAVERKKKPKTDAARKRDRERRRRKRHDRATTPTATSDGGGEQSSDGDQSSSHSDRGSRSLSPAHRSKAQVGPLAMVLHNGNMFGALEDDPSDDCDTCDEPQDLTMEEASIRQLCLARPPLEFSDPGGSSPPSQGGIPKRARRTASTSH